MRFKLGRDYGHDLESHRVHNYELILIIEEPISAIPWDDRYDVRRQAEEVEAPRDTDARMNVEVHAARPEFREPIAVLSSASAGARNLETSFRALSFARGQRRRYPAPYWRHRRCSFPRRRHPVVDGFPISFHSSEKLDNFRIKCSPGINNGYDNKPRP
jgi:hypothetical protein